MSESLIHPAVEAAAGAIAYVALEAHNNDMRKALAEVQALRDSILDHSDLLYGVYCLAVMMIPTKENTNVQSV